MMDDNAAMAEMPRYQCHKKVWALKIKEINLVAAGDHTILPEESIYAPFRVSDEYVRKHNPQVGGYYVVYDDGYASFSPAKAFEEGYTRLGQEPTHSTEENFQHFLTYEGLSQLLQPQIQQLRLAYFAGADIPPPAR